MANEKRTSATLPDGTVVSVEDRNARYTHAVATHCAQLDRWELVRWSGSERAIRSLLATINEKIRTGQTTADQVIAVPVLSR